MEDSSLPDTIEQVDNQTCKARTRVTMQRLLHGLGTQVPGHVQVASPQAPFFPKVPICSPPPFEKKVKVFVHMKRSVLWWTGTAVELEAKGQASAQSTTGTVTLGAQKKKKLSKLGNLEILVILRILTF